MNTNHIEHLSLIGGSQSNNTLYIGNLDESVTEYLLAEVFNKISTVLSCKIIQDANDIFAFIQFESHDGALQAIMNMNGRSIEGKPMKVNWAAGHSIKGDTSKHYHVFVGDLCPELDTIVLWNAFKKFGEVSDCKIIRDSATLKSKGYGFVSFVTKEDAEYAMREMNGVTLGSKVIRTNWASRKTITSPTNKENTPTSSGGTALSFTEVYKLASESNTTVYCGSIPPEMSVEDLRKLFSEHGTVSDVRVFGEKGYAFIKFANKESATNAIVKVNGTQYGDRILKCFWGKETPIVTTATEFSSNAYNNYVSQDTIPKMTAVSPVQYAATQYYPMAYTAQQQPYATVVPNQAAAAAAQAAFIPQQNFPQMYYQNWLPMQQGVQGVQMQYPTPANQPLVYEVASAAGYQTQ